MDMMLEKDAEWAVCGARNSLNKEHRSFGEKYPCGRLCKALTGPKAWI